MNRRSPIRSFILPLGLAAVSAWLQLTRLESRPLCGPELDISTEMRAFVQNGQVDRGGRHLPLFVEGLGRTFYAPVPIYAAVVSDRFTGSPSSFRMAAAAVAVASVPLLYSVAQLAFGSSILAATAAAFLLFTPAFVTLGSTFVHDGIWHVPFVGAWLLLLAVILQRTKPVRRPLAACTAVLVASVYSQPSASMMSLVLAAVTGLVLWQTGRLPPWRHLVACAAAAAAVSAPLLLWLLRHPATYADTLGAWLLHPAHLRSPRAWWLALSHPTTLTQFTGTYWDFFSPTHLVISENAQAFAGVFLLPVGVLAAIGVYAGLRAPERQPSERALMRAAALGVVCLPIGAASFLEAASIDKALAIVPLVTLLAARGVAWLWDSIGKRVVCVLLISLAIAQFVWWHAGSPSGTHGPCVDSRSSSGPPVQASASL